MVLSNRQIQIMLALLAVLLATVPMLFEIYRMAAFNTMPRDDYAPYLLTLVGETDRWPGAPFAYRIISVAVAIPFYYILPEYSFTNLQGVDPLYLKATLALSFSSFLWLVLSPVVIFLLARKEYHATKISALVVSLMTFLLAGFISRTGVDTLAVLILALLLLSLRYFFVFLPLILLSIGINEKVPIVIATILSCRLLASWVRCCPFELNRELGLSYLAVAGYFLLRLLLRVPGNEKQTDPTLFLDHLHDTILYSLSLKGFVLNILPVLVLLLMVFLAMKYRHRSSFQVVDISGFLVMLVLAGIADVVFNVGRIVMLTYPLYLPAVSAFIDSVLQEDTVSLSN